MINSTSADLAIRRYNWQLSSIVFILVFIRRWITFQYSFYSIHNTVILLVLLISWLVYWRWGIKLRRIFWGYIFFQLILIETLGFLLPAEDTWGLLFCSFWLELRSMYPSRKAYILAVSLGALMVVSLMITFDWWIGIGYGVFMIATGFLLISPNVIYEQSQAAQIESRRLLLELKKTHRKLAKASREVEELVEVRERDRMANELHDSVSQLMFSIKLLAQSTRLMIDKDPDSVPKQLEHLQELTGRALIQMRGLITQWRGET